MLRMTRFRLILSVALGLAGAAACSTERITGSESSARSDLLGFFNQGPALITCPAGEAQTATALMGPLGGVLAAGNTQVIIPANAVLSPTTFNLVVPASKYVE